MGKENEKEFENIQGVDAQAAALARRDEIREALVQRDLAPQTVDAARVASETQAMILMARSRPREFLEIKRGMQLACARTRLAEKAVYNYPRGGTQVTGPSIRLMEMLVGVFGNVDAGWRVLEADDERARVEAYAWDLENNVRKRIEFWVQFSRDTKAGVVPVRAERDKYEVVASAAQRRVRACIANILPFDLVDEAMECCAETVKKGDGQRPLVDRIADMVLDFENIGVSKEMLEELLKHPVTAIIVDEIPRLRGVFTAIAEGHAQREEFFKLTPVARGGIGFASEEDQKKAVKPAPAAAPEKPAAPAEKAVRGAPPAAEPEPEDDIPFGNDTEASPDDSEAEMQRKEDAKSAKGNGSSEAATSGAPATDAEHPAIEKRRAASAKAQAAARKALEGEQQQLGGTDSKKGSQQ